MELIQNPESVREMMKPESVREMMNLPEPFEDLAVQVVIEMQRSYLSPKPIHAIDFGCREDSTTITSALSAFTLSPSGVTKLHYQFSESYLLYRFTTFFPIMPVLETLGGALFGAVLQVLFDKLDSRQVLDYFCRRELDEKLLKKLKRKLMDINAVIDDAEQKQFSNFLVKAWLDEVRDVLLDAEDLLDEIDYEFSKCELEAEIQISASKVRSFESKMIEVLDELESLLNQKVVQNFKISSGVGSGLRNKVSQKLQSTSLVVENVIY
ncbi:unnamed protein product [Sphenostylis stenocarpa]|uniref:Disease resistance N-terminal domain-containing protein n=1 Tax=Sphenostylis stenocarpa TaxID=92480 RepID=A0AA87B893_9FABA|nr:unnamed protein product [Sphenostylis stenocarpa]